MCLDVSCMSTWKLLVTFYCHYLEYWSWSSKTKPGYHGLSSFDLVDTDQRFSPFHLMHDTGRSLIMDCSVVWVVRVLLWASTPRVSSSVCWSPSVWRSKFETRNLISVKAWLWRRRGSANAHIIKPPAAPFSVVSVCEFQVDLII